MALRKTAQMKMRVAAKQSIDGDKFAVKFCDAVDLYHAGTSGIDAVRGNSKGIDRIRKDGKAKKGETLAKSVTPGEEIARILCLDSGKMLN